ncbi:MAG: HDIG domain-containing metalloprotein [Christensenellales bacterium]
MEQTKKVLAKNWNWKVFLLSQIAVLICTAVVSVVTIFLISSIEAELQKASATTVVGIVLSNVLLFETLYVSLFIFNPTKLVKTSQYLIVSIIITITFVLCSVLFRYCSPFAMPIQLCAILLCILVGMKSGTIGVLNLVFIILVNLVLRGACIGSDIITITAAVVGNLLSGVAMIYLASKHYTRIKFLLYCLLAGICCIPYIIVLSISMGIADISLLFNVLWGLLSSAISIILYFPLVILFEAIFNTTDDFRLDELCRLDQPLLKRLASEAPGTFNHSLVVGNLAESCAIAIGENSRLAKAAAYYHDVGKLKAPIYFIENQSNYNPHDELIPEVSVSMITSHTMFGEILGKQYRLPLSICKICLEHHGTSPVGYFYQKALLLSEGNADKTNFSYQGPKPSTKVSAIIMIADTVEAATRAYMPPTKEEFVQRINSLVDEKLNLGQFDECPITMEELTVIKNTIINVLPSIHHSRVTYGEAITVVDNNE